MIRRIPAAVILIILLGLWSVSDGAPPQTKRIYDYIYDISGTAIRGANVSVELLNLDSSKVAYDSVSGASLGKLPPSFDTLTDAAGYFAVSLIPNSYIIPHGSRYQITVMSGRRLVYSAKVLLTAANDSVRARTIQ